jgi:hypothetical protein
MDVISYWRNLVYQPKKAIPYGYTLHLLCTNGCEIPNYLLTLADEELCCRIRKAGHFPP